MMVSRLLQLWLFIEILQGAPYKGGIITWRPIVPYTNASIVEVIIYQKHSWTLSRLQCNKSLIDSLGWYTDGGGPFTGAPFIQCQPLTSSCPGTGFTTISQRTYCTDFSTLAQTSSGALIKKMTLSRNTNIVVGYTGSAWPSTILMTNGAPASNWRVVTRIDLRLNPSGIINSSPDRVIIYYIVKSVLCHITVIGSLPIIRVTEGQLATIQIPIADWDAGDTLRCRWASSAGSAGDECGDICSNLPNATLYDYCSIRWLAVRRPVDISAGLTTSTYVAAIMLEDFYYPTNTIAMSSVPLQVLIYTYQPAIGACSILPVIIGDRPDRACVGAPVNVTLVERIVATVFCTGDYITEFITTSPLYMMKTAIANVSGTTNQWYITLTWTPTDDQIGPHIFCAAPVDQRGLTGSQHCIYFIAGYPAVNLIRPSLVQGSASPLGTIFANHSVFSILAGGTVYRPNRNGTYIQIFDRANSTLVWQADCGYSPDCAYSGQTLLFYVRNPMWTFGGHYYILFGSGVVSGTDFCAPESAPVTDPTFWTFDIWNPGVSSTMATTTTPPTIGTTTTRPASTITVSTALTMTSLSVTTASTAFTTTSITMTTSSVGTTRTNVITPTEPENQWKQPMIIGIVMGSLVMLLITVLFLYIYCTRQKKKHRSQVVPIITPQYQVPNGLTSIIEE